MGSPEILGDQGSFHLWHRLVHWSGIAPMTRWNTNISISNAKYLNSWKLPSSCNWNWSKRKKRKIYVPQQKASSWGHLSTSIKWNGSLNGYTTSTREVTCMTFDMDYHLTRTNQKRKGKIDNEYKCRATKAWACTESEQIMEMKMELHRWKQI